MPSTAELEGTSHAELVRLCGAEILLRKHYEGHLKGLVAAVEAQDWRGMDDRTAKASEFINDPHL